MIARFSEKLEHFALVRLHAGLIEGVDSQHISRCGAGDEEEIAERAEGEFVLAVEIHDKRIGAFVPSSAFAVISGIVMPAR